MPAQNSPEILALSNDAQALLAGYWGLGRQASLTMQNQAARFSDRATKAMQEIVAANILGDEKADDSYDESRTYRLTSHGQTLDFKKSLSWMKENARFSTTESINPEPPEPSGP